MSAPDSSGGEDHLHLIEQWVGHMDVPLWEHKGAYDCCLHCKSKFQRGHQHHCRLCGHMFCSRCTGKYHIPDSFKKKHKNGPVRVCYSCRDEAIGRRVEFERFKANAQGQASWVELPSFHDWRKQHRGGIINSNTIQKGSVEIYPPKWDPPGAYSKCFKCYDKFHKSHVHNCRTCGRLTCSECSSKMEVPPSFHYKKKPGPQRVCDMCRFLVHAGAVLVDREPPHGTEEHDAAEMRTSYQAPPPLQLKDAQTFELSTDHDDNDDTKIKSSIRVNYLSTCGHPDCDQPRVTRGFCKTHSSENEAYLGDPSSLVKQSMMAKSPRLGDKKPRKSGLMIAVHEDPPSPRDPSSTEPSQPNSSKASPRTIDINDMNMRIPQSRYRKNSAMEKIGRPYNVHHNTHVDDTLQWAGQNLQEVFAFERSLGEGAFGEVWKVTHRHGLFSMAVKMVSVAESEQKQSFLDEVGVLRQCKHPNIIGYFGCWGPDSINRLWVLMELCDIGSVPHLVKSTRTRLSERQIGYIMASMLNALVYLHAKKINHRDIKADNMLLNANGIVKLGDFGVANQHPNVQAGQKIDEEPEIVGTPNWLPPEMVGEHPVDFKGDIWSLGITAIELGEGVPYNNMSPLRIIRAIRTKPPPSLTQSNWSPEFKSFVEVCLTKDPHKRPSSADLLKHPFIASALDAMLPQDGVSPPSPLVDLIKKFFIMKAQKGDVNSEDEDEPTDDDFDSDEEDDAVPSINNLNISAPPSRRNSSGSQKSAPHSPLHARSSSVLIQSGDVSDGSNGEDPSWLMD